MPVPIRKKPVKVVLNKASIAALEVPSSGRVFYYDARTPGLCVAVTSAGSKTYYVYKWSKGRPVQDRLGGVDELTVDQARGMARERVVDMAKGVDVQARKRAAREEHTVGGLFNHWLESHAKLHKKTWAEDQRQFDTFLAPWRNRRLSTIGKADVQALHARIGRDHGHYAANRLLALVGSMFNKADDIGYRGLNPARGVKRFAEQSRDRFLQPDELPAFFRAPPG